MKSPPDAFTPILRQELKHYKQDIIHFLKSPQNLVASVATVGLPVDSVPRLATLATDEQGTFKNHRLFWCWLLCLVLVIMSGVGYYVRLKSYTDTPDTLSESSSLFSPEC